MSENPSQSPNRKLTKARRWLPLDVLWVVFSLGCLLTACLSVTMSLKQWAAQATIDMSYNDILALRNDAWLGVARRANSPTLLASAGCYAALLVLAVRRRVSSSNIGAAICGVALLAAVLLWAIC